MDLDRLNRWLTLGANLGVLVGIFFLAFELRQNNDLLQAQARETKLERRTGFNLTVASTPALARITAKLDQGQELTPTEMVQQEAYNRAILASFEWQFNEYRRGRLGFDDLEIGSWRVAFQETGNTRLMGETWLEWKNQASQEFADFMEEFVIRSEAE